MELTETSLFSFSSLCQAAKKENFISEESDVLLLGKKSQRRQSKQDARGTNSNLKIREQKNPFSPMNESRASEASRERGRQSSVRTLDFIDALKFKPQELSSILQDFRF